MENKIHDWNHQPVLKSRLASLPIIALANDKEPPNLW